MLTIYYEGVFCTMRNIGVNFKPNRLENMAKTLEKKNKSMKHPLYMELQTKWSNIKHFLVGLLDSIIYENQKLAILYKKNYKIKKKWLKIGVQPNIGLSLISFFKYDILEENFYNLT